MHLEKTVLYGPGGWYAEVYSDDDNASGCGEEAMCGRWYGTREECEAVDPAMVALWPMGEFRSIGSEDYQIDAAQAGEEW